jgi:hypothetical protein
LKNTRSVATRANDHFSCMTEAAACNKKIKLKRYREAEEKCNGEVETTQQVFKHPATRTSDYEEIGHTWAAEPVGYELSPAQQ